MSDNSSEASINNQVSKKTKSNNLFDQYKNGQITLVDLEKALPNLRPSVIEKTREKKPRTERQMENARKLGELAKKRAEDRKALSIQLPDTIPEDKILVRIEKRAPPTKSIASKTPRAKPQKESDSEYEVEEYPLSSCQPTPVQSPKKEKKAPKEKEKEKAKKEKKKPPKKEEKKKAKPKPRYETDTSTTSQYEDNSSSESDSSDDEQLKKYIRKTNKRVEALKQIDDRLKYVNPYTAKGLSLFS